MLAALALFLAQTSAASPGAALPREVRQFVADLDNSCRNAGGTPAPSPDLLRSVDLTRDGQLDHIVDVGRYNCTNAVSIFSAGHDGAQVSIFVGGPGRTARLGYRGTSHGVSITTHSGQSRVHLIVGALACGQPRNPDRAFSDWWFCSRPLDWDGRKSKFVFAPLSQAKRIH